MNSTDQSPKHGCMAWALGGFLYLILASEVIADVGALAIPFQAVMGMVFSLLFLGVVSLAGLVLRIPPLGRLWSASVLPALLILLPALGVFFFGHRLGLVTTVVSPDSGKTFQTLHPAASYGSIVAAMFAALHFPVRTKTGK